MVSGRVSAQRDVRCRLVTISGPIASGKSTLGAELSKHLRGAGLSVALTGLDLAAEMALPTLSDWAWAHSVHAQLVGAWLRTGVDMVVDEGTSSPTELQQVLDQVPDGARVFKVVLTADYDASLARAQADTGRGVSKDPAFLRADHRAYARQLPDMNSDLRLHVEDGDPDALVRRILRQLST